MKLIDLKTLSEQTCLSVSTLRTYFREGMPYYRIARKILVNPAEFDSWLQSFRCDGAEQAKSMDQLIDDAIREAGTR